MPDRQRGRAGVGKPFRAAPGLALWRGSFARDSFAWVAPPVLNPYTRIAIEMCPAHGILRAVGYELHDGEEFARPVTQPRELSIEAA